MQVFLLRMFNNNVFLQGRNVFGNMRVSRHLNRKSLWSQQDFILLAQGRKVMDENSWILLL
jgi:hypothetical protein